jgi:hypothetical protein
MAPQELIIELRRLVPVVLWLGVGVVADLVLGIAVD